MTSIHSDLPGATFTIPIGSSKRRLTLKMDVEKGVGFGQALWEI